MKPFKFSVLRRSARTIFRIAVPAVLLAAVAAAGQAPRAEHTASRPPWQRMLEGEIAKQVDSLEKAVAELEKQGRFAEAVGPAREALAIRIRVQGDDHWEATNARITEQAEVRMAALAAAERARMAAALARRAEAEKLCQEGHYAEAELLFRELAGVCRELLGEGDPRTVSCENDHANTLYALGKYAQAEALLRTVVAQDSGPWGRTIPIRRRARTIWA